MVEDKPTPRFGQPPEHKTVAPGHSPQPHMAVEPERTSKVVTPGVSPQPHMAAEPELPQGLADYTKAEIEAGKKANEAWEKRRKAEMDLGKKLASRFGPHKG